MKVEEFNIRDLPYCKTYILHIKNDYNTTQYYRTAENLRNKLLDYGDYNVNKVNENKKEKTFEMFISGKLPTKIKSRITNLKN